jgi:hypothetical protein
MKIIVKLEKEDIKTCKFGLNYAIDSPNFSLVFSPEALEELLSDIQNIKTHESKAENV